MNPNFVLLRTHIILPPLGEGNFALHARNMDVAEDVEAEECQREDWSSLFLK
jgi:hypothetical protein